MASLRSRLVRRVTSRYFDSVDPGRADIPAMRRRWDRLARYLPIARGVQAMPAECAGRPALWLDPPGAPPDKVFVYFHGGAYVMGSPATHRQMASHLARYAGVRALLPDYRLAPEHRFPAALEDALNVYRQLRAEGFDAANIAVGGDSAGGGLAMAMLIALRDAGDPLPAFAVLMSPWLDLTGSGDSMRDRAPDDPWFRPEHVRIVANRYCDADELTDPRVSPVFANLDGMPPLYIQVGSDEILLSDSTRLARGVEAAGGDAELEIWPDMWHVFQLFVSLVPEAGEALGRQGQRLGRALGTPSSES